MSAIPYAVGYTFTDSSYEARVGGEFSVSIDRHTLKGTYNTDASTLEADPFVFSFYKRKVSLAEKRPFFSRDLDVYRSPISLLYTRGIADINYGANYTFRSNTLKAGAFYVEEEPIPGDTTHNIRRFMAVRPNVVTKFVNFGGTFIHNEQTNGPSETIISGDARVDLPSRWVFVPQLATNRDGYASKAYLYYEFNPAGGPYADFSYTRFGKKFDGMTVINLFGKNYDEISNSVGYNFIYNRSYFHQMNARVEFYKAESLDRDFMLQRNINGNFFYKVNDWLSVNHYAEISNADEALSDTTKKNHNDYAQDHNVKILIGNNAIVLGYKEGSYYGQKLRNPYASYESMFFSRVGVSATAFLVENEARIFSAKINYRIMPKLFLRSLYQWKSEKGKSNKYDNFQLWNSMLQYEFFAGSNLYLVLNLQGEDLEYVGRYCKLAYEFNF
ncbi:MAG TPA: hypothetical protein PLH27_06850 [bacterium]|nr:hypothetical protein [bacterium]HMZ05229.1 hypothetical protein [bacterium]HNB10686.1 hypothetical protein [bacterium]HNB55667.1 hypothetical protein [bacterium]HNC48683.1 hypothetical protein [bacterium]